MAQYEQLRAEIETLQAQMRVTEAGAKEGPQEKPQERAQESAKEGPQERAAQREAPPSLGRAR